MVDVACVISVLGDVWWEAYCEVAKELAVDDLIERVEVCEKFWFGDGGALVSYEAFRLPAVVAEMLLFLCWLRGQ